MKHFSLAIVSFFVLVHAFSSQAAIIEGLVKPLMRHLTLPKVIQGGVNNGLLGLFYYQLIYKAQQENKVDVERFIQNTKPWEDAPEVLQKYEPRIFTAGNNPTKNPISRSLFPDGMFYIINGKVFVSHKIPFDLNRGEFSDYDLYRAIAMEYQRQNTLAAFQSDSTKSFWDGVCKFIAAKKVGSKIIYPILRPFLEKKGLYFFWTYPRIALGSIADLSAKLFYGLYNWFRTRDKKYIESYNEISDRWKEAEARELKKNSD